MKPAATLITLTVVGGFVVLCCYAYGRADALRPHPVAIHVGEPDMDAPAPSDTKVNPREVGKFFKRVMKEAKAHEDAVTLAEVFSPAASEELSVAFDPSTSRPQKFTKLWGPFTRQGSQRYEYAEAK